jgi:hypothetical protein
VAVQTPHSEPPSTYADQAASSPAGGRCREGKRIFNGTFTIMVLYMKLTIFQTFWFSFIIKSLGFVVPTITGRHSRPFLSNTSEMAGSCSPVVDKIVKDLHSSGFSFRIIVLANGSILETTVALSGTTISKSISPKTGEPITTIASTDKSFELHLKTNQISRVTFNKVQRGENGKVMRVCRLMDRDGSLSTSLILQAEMGEDHPRRWFDEMINQYGEEVVL